MHEQADVLRWLRVKAIPPLTLLALLFSPACAEAERVALVMGNDAYRNVPALHSARADAQAVAKALESVGFKVTLKQDLSQQAMKATWRAFKQRVSGGDDVVFYFAGHGVQLRGTNYLIPTDIDAQGEDQVSDDSLPLQRVLDDLSEQKARFTLAIIDACRDNPFKGTGRGIGGRGLAIVSAATGQMVLYSAGAGQEALDRLGPNDPNPNGLFTRVLIREMKKPGVSVGQVLANVRVQVVALAKTVNHEQVPALYDQTLNLFYFVPPTDEGTAGRPSMASSEHSGSAGETVPSPAGSSATATTSGPAVPINPDLRKPAGLYSGTFTISSRPGRQWSTFVHLYPNPRGGIYFSPESGHRFPVTVGGPPPADLTDVGHFEARLQFTSDENVAGTASWRGGKGYGYASERFLSGTAEGRVSSNGLDLRLSFGTVVMTLQVDLTRQCHQRPNILIDCD